jgi:L-lactate dehydrogenase complex protein LldG
MEESTSREKVLKKIRNALIYKSDNPFPDIDLEKPLYKDFEDSIDITFAQEFTNAGGKFIFCEDENEFVLSLKFLAKENEWNNLFCTEPKLLEILNNEGISYNSGENEFLQMKVGITLCEALVARTGSVVVSSKHRSGRRLNVFPEIHVVMAYASQLVPDIKDAFKLMKEKYKSAIPSMITMVTGPSRTADIEKTLVMGAHGPKDLYVFLIDDNIS